MSERTADELMLIKYGLEGGEVPAVPAGDSDGTMPSQDYLQFEAKVLGKYADTSSPAKDAFRTALIIDAVNNSTSAERRYEGSAIKMGNIEIPMSEIIEDLRPFTHRQCMRRFANLTYLLCSPGKPYANVGLRAAERRNAPPEHGGICNDFCAGVLNLSLVPGNLRTAAFQYKEGSLRRVKTPQRDRGGRRSEAHDYVQHQSGNFAGEDY